VKKEEYNIHHTLFLGFLSRLTRAEREKEGEGGKERETERQREREA
jgi:hypothetical protein